MRTAKIVQLRAPFGVEPKSFNSNQTTSLRVNHASLTRGWARRSRTWFLRGESASAPIIEGAPETGERVVALFREALHGVWRKVPAVWGRGRRETRGPRGHYPPSLWAGVKGAASQRWAKWPSRGWEETASTNERGSGGARENEILGIMGLKQPRNLFWFSLISFAN